jgi:hypothetical protein
MTPRVTEEDPDGEHKLESAPVPIEENREIMQDPTCAGEIKSFNLEIVEEGCGDGGGDTVE